MERNNLWAPWRIKYVQHLDKGSPSSLRSGHSGSKTGEPRCDCFICDDVKQPENDVQNLVLWRTSKSIVVLNRFPYNNGHLLIAPARHIAELSQTTDEELLELVKLMREVQRALTLAIQPHGFNVGMNFGRCAGAGLPGHLHIHVVPRWDGDTNFMSVCSDTDVISQSMMELLDLLRQLSSQHNLPQI